MAVEAEQLVRDRVYRSVFSGSSGHRGAASRHCHMFYDSHNDAVRRATEA